MTGYDAVSKGVDSVFIAVWKYTRNSGGSRAGFGEKLRLRMFSAEHVRPLFRYPGGMVNAARELGFVTPSTTGGFPAAISIRYEADFAP